MSRNRVIAGALLLAIVVGAYLLLGRTRQSADDSVVGEDAAVHDSL